MRLLLKRRIVMVFGIVRGIVATIFSMPSGYTVQVLSAHVKAWSNDQEVLMLNRRLLPFGGSRLLPEKTEGSVCAWPARYVRMCV